MIYSVLAVVLAYVVGSLSFAVIVSRVMGLQDPRTFGSKNPGATNVLRSGSKAAAVLTLLLDCLKGFVPVLVVAQWGGVAGIEATTLDATVAAVGLAAFLGHLYPVFFGFVGGKGVATALGVLLGWNPVLAGATLLTWLIVAYFFRYSSLASIVAAVFAPVYYLLGSGVAWYLNTALAAAVVVMGGLLVWRHRANITRLMQGKESKLGGSKAKPTESA